MRASHGAREVVGFKLKEMSYVVKRMEISPRSMGVKLRIKKKWVFVIAYVPRVRKGRRYNSLFGTFNSI